MRSQQANTYDRFVETIRTTLDSAGSHDRNRKNILNHQIAVSKEKGNNQSQFQPSNINKSPGLRRRISARTSSNNTTNIEVSGRSDHALNTSMRDYCIRANFGDRKPPSQLNSMSSRKPKTAKLQQGTWCSKLFRSGVIGRSKSSYFEVSKAEKPFRTFANTDFQAQDNENSPIKTVTTNAKDPFSLSNQPEAVGKIQEEYESMKVDCETMKVIHDGENSVVYGKWFDFNDDVVTEVFCDNFKNVFQGLECAYMLFYRRSGQTLK